MGRYIDEKRERESEKVRKKHSGEDLKCEDALR